MRDFQYTFSPTLGLNPVADGWYVRYRRFGRTMYWGPLRSASDAAFDRWATLNDPAATDVCTVFWTNLGGELEMRVKALTPVSRHWVDQQRMLQNVAVGRFVAGASPSCVPKQPWWRRLWAWVLG